MGHKKKKRETSDSDESESNSDSGSDASGGDESECFYSNQMHCSGYSTQAASAASMVSTYKRTQQESHLPPAW